MINRAIYPHCKHAHPLGAMLQSVRSGETPAAIFDLVRVCRISGVGVETLRSATGLNGPSGTACDSCSMHHGFDPRPSQTKGSRLETWDRHWQNSMGLVVELEGVVSQWGSTINPPDTRPDMT